MIDSAHEDRADFPLCPEVVARVMEALSATPASASPSACAQPIYDALVAAGLGRAEVLAVAGSLMDLVANEVEARREPRALAR